MSSRTQPAEPDVDREWMRVEPADASIERFVWHPSFDDDQAELLYNPETAPTFPSDYETPVPDEDIRDVARRMHYAAHRLECSHNAEQASYWKRWRYELRNRLAVKYRGALVAISRKTKHHYEDLDERMGELVIKYLEVIIDYNPWYVSNLSSFLWMCVARLSWQFSKKRLVHMIDVRRVGEDEDFVEPKQSASVDCDIINGYFKPDSKLLTELEKAMLLRRFGLGGHAASIYKDIAKDYEKPMPTIVSWINVALEKLRVELSSRGVTL